MKYSSPINSKKNIARKLFFIGCVQGLLGLQQAYAATYYVSPSGSDNNSGTSLSSPVKTINKALSKAQSSGDIVYVTTGTYAEAVSIGQSGITLSAYQDNKPVIDGGNTLPSGDWGALIKVDGNNNKISGFEVKNSNINGAHAGGHGIWLLGHHNQVSKMDSHHAWGVGILAEGDYSIVEDSKIWQASRGNANNTGQTTSGWGTGISAARNRTAAAIKKGINSYAILRRNTVFNNWGEGLSCYEADHCTLEDNIVYDNWTNNLYVSDTTNSLVQRNIVYVSSNPAIITRDSAQPGITLADEVASLPRSANNTIINNFIYNADFGAFYWTLVPNSGLNNVLIANNTIVDGDLFTGSGSIVNTNSQIRNNIVLGRNSNIPSKSGITFSNNNWSVTPSSAAASTNITGDPQLARTGATTPGALTSAYFKVSGSSPVIDAAMPLTSVTNDFFQVSRGTAPDIGGHEFQTSNAQPTDTTAPSVPTGLSATAGSSTKVDLAWSASTDNVNVAGYKIYRDGTQIGTSAATSFADSSVTAGTTYNYTVKAYDTAGNISVSSNTATVKTSAATAAVNITSYYVGNRTATSASINWTTDIPSSGVVSYGTSSSNLSSQVTAGNQATSHSVQITGLARRTTYYYKITTNGGSVTSSFRTSRW